MTQRRLLVATLIALLAACFVVLADVPGRALPSGAVPNPGTQQQELTNITFPGEFNVFEFVVTCAGCHGGTIDQHAAHFGNWAGGSMASAARDPVFRANQIGVNSVVRSITGLDGAGNVCFRCHSPNGWLSGRFDPSLGGRADGANMIQSILLSTDGEGIACETCHRAVGNVTYKRPDVATNASTGLLDSVWNLLAGLSDWEHAGRPATDQDRTPTLADGFPFGDTALQYQDGVAYTGKYSGTGDFYFSDLPVNGSYTGQIYAVYPDWWLEDGNPVNPVPPGQPEFNAAGQKLAWGPDGTLPPLFEVPIGVPTRLSTGRPDYPAQGLSLEHPTAGSAGRVGSLLTPVTLNPSLPPGPGGLVSPDEFIRSSEFCGTCHDLTVPIVNHGMPEQRTYTEWKYSALSGAGVRCQDCHMPSMRREYNDANPDTVNPDPALAGTFPYAKNRAAQGGTAFHKLTGANRDLGPMMKALYPEVDLEVVGAPTGKDPRAFPGMLSDRGPMWDRAMHNSEITLRDGVDVKILQAPLETPAGSGVYELKVRVTNRTGHRIPSGYPDGRRFWLAVDVFGPGGPVYKSGYYDDEQARLFTDLTTDFNRALTNVIDARVANAVMVYERVTGTCLDSTGAAIFPDPTAATPVACVESPALTNNFLLFDNRVPPRGLDYASARLAGVKFWNYDSAKTPFEDQSRYTPDQLAGGYDDVTYVFAAPTGLSLSASVNAYWQTHTREFMEHLRGQDGTTVRPQRPPNVFDPNYPMNPNYISSAINGLPLSSYTALDGSTLNDNWGGVAYAAWLATGKGAPFLVDRDDTSAVAPTVAPVVTARALNASDPGYIDPVSLAPDSFAAKVEWTPVPGADGYVIWIRYGKSDATADWDRLAVVGKAETSFVEHVLGDASPTSPGKTYGFKVVAFNGKGEIESNIVDHTVASALPAAPSGLVASTTAPGSSASQITLTWTDNATNEIGFEAWRIGPVAEYNADGTLVPVVYGGAPPATVVGLDGAIPSATTGPAGGVPATGPNTFVDDGTLAGVPLKAGACYNYQIRSVNVNLDRSTWAVAATQGCTLNVKSLNLTATPDTAYRIDLAWTTNATGATQFRILRGLTPGNLAQIATVPATAASSYAWTDTTVVPDTTYYYRVNAVNAANTELAHGTANATTPAVPAAPTDVTTAATAVDITVSWVDHATNEDGFVLERAVVTNGVVGAYVPLPAQGAFLPPNTTSYVDTVAAGGLLENTLYQYRVKAIHLVNGDSSYATGTPVALITRPVPPTAFAARMATALPVPRVLLSWVDQSINESAFNLQRHTNTNSCNAATGWTSLPSAPANATAYTDPGVSSGTGYCYRIRATNAAGDSAWVTTTVNVPAAPGTPASPTSVAPPANTPRTLVVTFNVSNTVLGWELRRGSNTIVASGTTTGALSFTDSNGLADATTYTYFVHTYNAGGFSNWSQGRSGTTLGVTAPATPGVANAGNCNGANNGGFNCRQDVSFTIDASATNWVVQRCAGSTSNACAPGSANWSQLTTGTGTGNQTVASRFLTRNTTYNYRVNQTSAINTSGWSDPPGTRTR